MLAKLSKHFFIFMLSVSTQLMPHSANAETSFDSVKNLIEQQNIEKAFQDIKTLQAEKNELLPEVQILFGDLYLALERPAKAFDYFEKVLFSSTQYDAEANAGMAEASYRLGNVSKASQLADKSLNENPDLIRAKLVKGALLADQGEFRNSARFYKEAIASSRQRSLAARKFAETLIRHNRLGEAEETVKNALIKSGQDGPTLELYGELKFLQGDFTAAIDYRIQAEEKYRKAGNSIKADEMLAWLNVRGKPELKEIEKSRVQEKAPEQTAVEPIAQPTAPESPRPQVINVTKPRRAAFPPKSEPDPIFYDDEKPVTTGSGTIINNGLWVLTNKHVVENLDYAMVRNGLGETRIVEEIILADTDDLAVLILDKSFNSAYSFNMSSFVDVAPGENVFVMGYPMASIFGSFHPTLTTGIVSNPKGFGGKEGEFQTTAKINPGNSGGPIFNIYGEIVGLATGNVDREKVRQEDGLIISDLAFGVNAPRIIQFLNRPIPASMNAKYEYSPANLYKYMRSGVVFIVGQ